MSLPPQTFLAYIAGFLDGDGSIYVRAKPNPSYKYGYQIAPYVVFFQSTKETEFPNMMNELTFGSLRERKDGMYEYTVGKHEELKAFLETLIPYLRLKKKQALLMLKILECKKLVNSLEDFAKLLEMVEEFRELNYSKKRIKRTMTP
ncbi:hypothetical protein COZ82_03500 [Candidatus Kaiserbacteria bacterium CG_4_8_14_3_um_filter_38_9]|uniref:Homing endonuclease LAGLIDADG domain-containing protein n=1 Tax=Candidatus Kaiserbacteria bacterium CG_4_8_14_3_um_filter_38_9 TaxID=1974599 RepID=A0A2M7IN67_9BACT|nr:MAG: hypothetical protein COZ82_03500 [Candidatus Kaiserbacteria bacterium CG_4_8_14_3_um_filter_38_9]